MTSHSLFSWLPIAFAIHAFVQVPSAGAQASKAEAQLATARPNPQPEPRAADTWRAKTLFDSLALDHLDHGGYGAVMLRTSQIKGSTALFVGGRGGWLINHRLVLGGGGYGQSVAIRDNVGELRNTYLEFGYGGGYVGYHLFPEQPVHVLISTLVGAGGIAHSQRGVSPEERTELDGDAVFVLEPSIDLELNLLEFMRFQIGIAYRWVQDVDLPGTSARDLSAFSFGGGLAFGKF